MPSESRFDYCFVHSKSGASILLARSYGVSIVAIAWLPEDWSEFRLPPALDARLTELLNHQDHNGCLNEAQRSEAEALCNLVDMLALLKLRFTSIMSYLGPLEGKRKPIILHLHVSVAR